MFLLCRHNSGFNHPCTPFCTLYYVLCLQPHSVYKSYPSDLFPTGLAEIIGQSSIYVEHLPPSPLLMLPSFEENDDTDFVRFFYSFFLVRLTLIAQDYDGSLERLAKESDCLKQVGPKGEIMQNLVQTYAFEEIARGAVIFSGGEKEFLNLL